MNACFRMALGDFDWGDLARNGRFEAGIYFWIFQILVVLVLLNMLLAIVMDAYTDVTASSGNAETIWFEAAQTFVRWNGVRKKELVPMTVVLKCLDKDSGGRLRTMKSLLADG